jgi:hypothetical protein
MMEKEYPFPCTYREDAAAESIRASTGEDISGASV